jgi:hypothetical protein
MANDLKRWMAWGTLVAFAAVSLVLVAQSTRRIAFIIEHGGMDCATCDGSPVAFLIGWGVELFVLGIALLLSWLAWRHLRHVPKAI